MSSCQSCGMPMTKPEDYGGGQPNNTYCKYCTDDQGKLLPQAEVREKMIKFQMESLDKTREQAETDVDKHMDLMPAWKIGVGGSPAKGVPGKPPLGTSITQGLEPKQGGPTISPSTPPAGPILSKPLAQPTPPPSQTGSSFSKPLGMPAPKPPAPKPGVPSMAKLTPKPEPFKDAVGLKPSEPTISSLAGPSIELVPGKPPVSPTKPSIEPDRPFSVSKPFITGGTGPLDRLTAKPDVSRPGPVGPTEKPVSSSGTTVKEETKPVIE